MARTRPLPAGRAERMRAREREGLAPGPVRVRIGPQLGRSLARVGHGAQPTRNGRALWRFG